MNQLGEFKHQKVIFRKTAFMFWGVGWGDLLKGMKTYVAFKIYATYPIVYVIILGIGLMFVKKRFRLGAHVAQRGFVVICFGRFGSLSHEMSVD